ncbi:hypothetical protein XELAEV_18029147mg [Xenopus laevis]|uniref:Uncharacterized protein n=1 Tax=Xenopus laevis TaxID=8355 RepID=A0A974HHE8_XENLA|nr:hypothetical protein XELAEV_18029147mg [Xenopus laevis]
MEGVSQSRESKLERVFFQDTNTDLIPIREFFINLESKTLKEIKLWWEIASFEKYITLNMIPRGLRIKKYPTSRTSNIELMNNWNSILSDCSPRLMNLIVETEIMERKTQKFKRHKRDYDQKRIYNWSRFIGKGKRNFSNTSTPHQKSILKSTRSKHVSSSETDFESSNSVREQDTGGCSSSPFSSQETHESRALEVFSGNDDTPYHSKNGKKKKIFVAIAPMTIIL